MSDLQSDHLKDLLRYHTGLRQFLSVSSAPAKPNPKRAAKAREKLLKLSATQFYELTTDVYDELERRIDESREEPDFLLPKSTFHPKRNEAREKLGSLQQARFRDLVSDIFYEIERRGYNKPQPQQQHPSPSTKHSSTRYSEQSLNYEDQKESPPAYNTDHSNRVSDHSNKNGVVGLQSTTVIPTKAELAWSSDSEKDEEVRETGKQSRGLANHKRESKLSNRDSSPYIPEQQRYHQKRYSNHSSINRQSYGSETDLVGEMHDSAFNGKRTSQQLNRGLSVLKTRNKDREIEVLLEEATKMDGVITQLEQKNALLQSKSDKFQHETKDLEKHLQALKSKITFLENDISTKDLKLKELNDIKTKNNNGDEAKDLNIGSTAIATRHLQPDTVSGKIDQTALDDMKKEVFDWRSKFEDLKLKRIDDLLSLDSISESSISGLLTISGLIPINVVKLLHASIQSFLIFLNKNSNTGKKDEIDVNTLFDHISKISNISGKIASFAPQSEKSDLIRASISHSITSARYYALYSEFLPKLIIESAVSEIAFSICDLISEVKLNKDDFRYDASEFSNPNTNPENDKDVPNEISPVRPLRMAKKMGETLVSHSSTTFENPSTTTPRPLNLTINTQGANSFDKSFTSGASAKRPIQGLNGLTSPGSLSAAKKPSVLENKNSPSFLSNINNNNETRELENDKNTSGSNVTTPTSVATPLRKSGLSSIMSRYSPESQRKSRENSPVQGLRKSSSGNILSKVRQFEQQGSDTSSTSGSPQRSVVSPFSDSKFGKNSPKRSSLESQTEPSSTETTKYTSKDTLKGINNNESNSVGKIDDDYSKTGSNEIKPVSQVSASNLEDHTESLRSMDIQSMTANKPQVSDNFTSNESKPQLKSPEASVEAPNEVEGMNYDGDSDEDFTSLDQLKGEIMKNADLKPKSQNTAIEEEEEEEEEEQQQQQQQQQPLENDVKKAIVYKDNDYDEDEEEDLNELANDDEIANNGLNKNVNYQTSRLINGSKSSNDDKYAKTECLKFERKQLNELYVDLPPSSLNKEKNIQPNESTPNMNTNSTCTTGIAKTGAIKGLNDNVVRPLNLGINSGQSSNLRSDVTDTPNGFETKHDGDDFITAQEPQNNDDNDSEEEVKDSNGNGKVNEREADDNRRYRNDIEEDFDVRQFDIEDPDNTLSELLLYLEHQTVKVISTIQTLLTSIKAVDSTKGELRSGSRAINAVVSQMVDATSNSMNQSRNGQLREHGIWVVQSLEDSGRRMDMLCNSSSKDADYEDDNEDYADKHFKQRLAGIAFDVAKCTKELVKTVEEANLKEEIAHLNAKLGQ